MWVTCGWSCVWASSILFERRMDRPKGRQGKKKKGADSTFVLRAIKTIADLTSSSLMHPSFCNG